VANADARDDADGPPVGPTRPAAPPERVPARAARRARAMVEDAGRKAPPPVVRIVTRAAGALRDIEPFDRAMVLAAQAFTGLFPVIIVVTALLPRSNTGEVVDDVSDGLALPDSTRQVLEQLVPADADTRGAFGILGILITVISATSFSRALARMYGKVWGVRPPGWSGGWRWLAALFGVLLFAGVLAVLRRISGGGAYATLGELATTVLLAALLWTWVPWLLLMGRVGWRRLLPGGVLMGIGMAGTSVASGIYLPRALVSASRQFGALGVAFTYIGWLFVVSFVLVGATVIGHVLARDESVVRFLGSEPSAPRTPPG
jgi:membrane protein